MWYKKSKSNHQEQVSELILLKKSLEDFLNKSDIEKSSKEGFNSAKIACGMLSTAIASLVYDQKDN